MFRLYVLYSPFRMSYVVDSTCDAGRQGSLWRLRVRGLF